MPNSQNDNVERRQRNRDDHDSIIEVSRVCLDNQTSIRNLAENHENDTEKLWNRIERLDDKLDLERDKIYQRMEYLVDKEEQARERLSTKVWWLCGIAYMAIGGLAVLKFFLK